METRTDFQRLLENMDKIIKSRQEELAELEERLDSSRERLSQKEAKELASIDNESAAIANQQAIDDYVQEQRITYERHIARLTDELAGLENINISLVRENEHLKYDRNVLRDSYEKLKAKSLLLGENLDEIQRANFDLNIRLAQAEKESQQQQRLLKRSAEQDQVLLNAFNDKLKSLEETLETKEQEIKRLRLDNQFTLESLGIKINYNDRDDPGDIDYRQQQTTLSSSTSTTDGLIDSGNKQRIIEIARALREKDAQIELLKRQLLEASKELESNANLIESLTNRQTQLIKSGDGDDDDGDGDEHTKVLGSLGESKSGLEELKSSCRMLENELEAKDKQLHLIETRIHHYEMILPGKIIDLIEELKAASLKSANEHEVENSNDDDQRDTSLHSINQQRDEKVNALADSLIRVLEELNSSQRLLDIIDQLKSINASKDAQVRRLVTDLNDLDAKLNSVQQEQQQQLTSQEESAQQQAMSGVQLISESGDVQGAENNEPDSRTVPATVLDTSGANSNEPMVVEPTLNVENLPGTSPIEGLQSEGQTGDEPTLAAEGKTTNVGSAAAQIESTSTSTSAATDSDKLKSPERNQLLPDSKRKSIEQSIKIPSSSTKFIGLTTKPPTASIESALDLQYRLRQLESENQLLELAMKEILLSIRWSDSQCSTILIDCPSLERLCQLIEARFITSQSMGLGGHHASVAPGEPSRGLQSNNTNVVGELIQFITVKAELDILRGQNEQLRVDLKTQRREYHELMQNMSERRPSGDQETQHDDDVEGQTSLQEVQEEQQPLLEQVVELVPHNNQEKQQQKQWLEDGKCRSCSRLSQLTQYFLACITKIEAHVTSSDETFVNRLTALHQLTQRLGKDLSVRENLIGQLNRKCDSLSQQRLIIQTKLNSLENRMNVHSKVCPLVYLTKSASSTGAGGQVGRGQVLVASTGHNESVRSMTTRGDYEHHSERRKRGVETPLRENKMTITVLTSIIDCLKAMLNFKDERIQRLERLLTSER